MTPAAASAIRVDLVILGGGISGLWLLDAARRGGYRAVLLEARALGSGQSIASQGILHGGLKYTLKGITDPHAAVVQVIRQMPGRWRAALEGTTAHDALSPSPDLRSVPVESPCCYLWRGAGLKSTLSLLGAASMLQTSTSRVADADRPAALRSCPGAVYRVQEQCVEPWRVLRVLREANAGAMALMDDGTLGFERSPEGKVTRVEFASGGQQFALAPGHVVLAAGSGNATLRELLGLDARVMQRRPLHMVMLRGRLPVFHGHCVDGAKTRVTITTHRFADADASEVAWQVGGNVAEKGVEQEPGELLAFARRELAEVLPDVDLSGALWGTYRVDRAEEQTRQLLRPDDVSLLDDGNVLTAWPTKLVLAPRLADVVLKRVGAPAGPVAPDDLLLPGAAKPAVAPTPWEECTRWTHVD